MKEFSQWTLDTNTDHAINTIIMTHASDTAEKLTELECKLHDIQCWIVEGNERRFTEDAQDIFNDFYDEEMNELYDLLNVQLEIINENQ